MFNAMGVERRLKFLSEDGDLLYIMIEKIKRSSNYGECTLEECTLELESIQSKVSQINSSN